MLGLLDKEAVDTTATVWVNIPLLIVVVVIVIGEDEGAAASGGIEVISFMISPLGNEKYDVPALVQQLNDRSPSQQYWPLEHWTTA